MNKPRYLSLVLIILLVLLFAAARPYAVFADDETPPTPEPTEEVVDTGEPTPTEVSTTAADEEIPSAAEIIDQLPEGTDLVVLDESGEALSLVTEQAAEVLVTGDPVWCPAVQPTPTPGSNGCTAGYGNMTDLLTYLTGLNGGTGPAASGTIWIEDSYDSLVNDPATLSFTLDGTTLTTWDDYALTVQGGWNGSSGSSTITGVSEFRVPLSVLNWDNSVTLNDLLISSTGGNGLRVETSGNIALDNVDSSGNAGHGLHILTDGNVFLTDVTANSNSGDGANIDAGSNVTIDGFVGWPGSFSYNQGSGLFIFSDGEVSLANVFADTNSGDGVFIANNLSPGYDVNIEDSQITNSGGNGLVVQSAGNVSLTDVVANYNSGGDGAIIRNDFGSGYDVTIDATDSGLSSGSYFQSNDGNGLFIVSLGDVSLTDVVANYNTDGDGAYIRDYGGAVTIATNYLTGFYDISNFDQNSGNGLYIDSFGDVSLSDLEAGSNTGGYGAYIRNNSGFLAGVGIDAGYFDGNAAGGLYVLSGGNVALTDVSASDNTGGSGAFIQNNAGSGNITLTGTNTFNSNYGAGLIAASNGAINVNNVASMGNKTLAGIGASLSNSGVGNTAGINLTGTNSFIGNASSGLSVSSNGAISGNDLTVSFNGALGTGYGANLINSGGSGGINLTGTNTFNNNSGAGLTAASNGAIDVNNVTASNNFSLAGIGASLINSGVGNTAGITLTGTNVFSSNPSFGLSISSNGAISANDLTASGNGLAPLGGYGASLLSHTAGITLTGTNVFNTNHGTGLTAISNGAINVNNITASGNTASAISTGGGALMVNSSTDGITLTGTNVFSSNASLGLGVNSSGAISANNLTASNNGLSAAGGYGAILNNSSGTGDVTLTGTNVFNANNLGDGLTVSSNGTITVNNVTASGNTGFFYGGTGASLVNTSGSAGVSVIGTNAFSGNSASGLVINSNGVIYVDPITVDGNSSMGAQLIAGGSDITVDCGTFSNNPVGISASTTGTLTLDDVTFLTNGTDYLAPGATIVVATGSCIPSPPTEDESGSDDESGPSRNIIPVTGGVSDLNCELFGGTKLILPNGDSALFPCPINGTASLFSVGADALPGDLPDGDTFGSAFTAAVKRNNSAVSTLDSSITLSFVIPDGMGDSLAILFWDGSAWVELAGGHATGDGHFEASTNHTGTFVLVSK